MIVLGMAYAAKDVPLGLILGAAALMVPMNVLIFALDNLFFLMFPFRTNQEGIEVFLRTTLIFTAKGITFGVAMALTVAWTLVATSVSNVLSSWSGLAIPSRPLIFLGGVVLLGSLSAVAITLTAIAYHRFDVGQDVPA